MEIMYRYSDINELVNRTFFVMLLFINLNSMQPITASEAFSEKI
jgi:hypothetical protein